MGRKVSSQVLFGRYVLFTGSDTGSVMTASAEKAKLVSTLNWDAARNLTISSPLEAHKNASIIHHIVGVDVGFGNPLYAALEVEAFNNAEKVRLH